MSNPAAHLTHLTRRASFEETFLPLEPQITRFAAYKTRNWHDAEDLRQDTLLLILKRMDEGLQVRQPLAYAKLMVVDIWARNQREAYTMTDGVSRRRFVPLVEEDFLTCCPNCGAKLQARSCKMVCPRCGYHESCADGGER